MSARHGRGDDWTTVGAAAFSVAVVVTIVLIVSLVVHAESTGNDHVAGTGSVSMSGSPAPTPTTPPSTTVPTPTHSTAASTSAATSRRADPDENSLASLIAEGPSGGVSVSAVNLATGKRVTAGATHGMLEASVSKIALLEILLLERQTAGKLLSDNDDDQLTQMIEHSSNDAANDVFELAGGHEDVVEEQTPLGLNTKITIYGPGNLWGLTTTSASQQITLLNNLVDPDSPLNAASRAYALNLLQHVEADQQWGVPVAADKGSTFAVKNGWLAVDDDHDLWAVNSEGIITVHGQRLLVSVMTQHDESYAGGITFVEKLVRAAVATVT